MGGPAAVDNKTAGANGKPKPKVQPAAAQAVEAEGSADAAQKPLAPVNGESEDGPDAKKPLFQFTGDENFDGSDEDDEVSCYLAHTNIR